MRRGAKTITVDEVIGRFNDFFLKTKDEEVGQREGAIVLLENILFSADCYKGFRHLSRTDFDKANLRFETGSNRRHYFSSKEVPKP